MGTGSICCKYVRFFLSSKWYVCFNYQIIWCLRCIVSCVYTFHLITTSYKLFQLPLQNKSNWHTSTVVSDFQMEGKLCRLLKILYGLTWKCLWFDFVYVTGKVTVLMLNNKTISYMLHIRHSIHWLKMTGKVWNKTDYKLCLGILQNFQCT